MEAAHAASILSAQAPTQVAEEGFKA